MSRRAFVAVATVFVIAKLAVGFYSARMPNYYLQMAILILAEGSIILLASFAWRAIARHVIRTLGRGTTMLDQLVSEYEQKPRPKSR